MDFDFTDDIAKQLAALKGQLKDPSKPLLSGQTLMKWIGLQGVAVSRRAFMEQKLGDIKWPARYEGQKDPKFNYAGALMDWKSGRPAPRPNRFQDRPALIDRGERGGLLGSITYRATGTLSVAWGSRFPNAAISQEGGVAVIPWDKATKERAMDWLYKTKPIKGKMVKTQFKKGKVKVGVAKTRQRGDYAEHIHTLFAKNPWTQRVAARPFVGIPETLAKDIKASVVLYFKKVQQ